MTILTGVKSLRKEYADRLEMWQRCRDVVAGQDAVHAAKEAYLPRLHLEPDELYLARIKRTPFFNASWRTVASFVGMLFRKPPTVETPAGMDELLKDVTGSGIGFENFMKNAAYENLTVSRCGIHVDHPAKYTRADGRTPTLAEAQKLGLRPTMALYKTEAIYNWEERTINNRVVLSRVRLYIDHVEKVNEFETRIEERIKILELDDANLYRIRIAKRDTEEQVGEAIYPELNGVKLDYIPFYFIGADGTDADPDDPVMIDLFDHNLKHYGVSADYEHACHMTALPTPWVTGYRTPTDNNGKPLQEEFYIGSTTAWIFPDKDTKCGFLEYTGAGIESIKDNLTEKKAEMAAIGARMLTPEKAGVEATGSLIIRNTGEHSILAAVALSLSEGGTNALKMFVAWSNKQGECKFEINRDFMPFAIDPQALSGWIAAVQNGNMDKESLFDLMKRGDLFAPDLTFEEYQARVDANPPMPEPVAARPLPEGTVIEQPKRLTE